MSYPPDPYAPREPHGRRPRSSWSWPVILIAVLAGLLLVLAAVLAAILLTNRSATNAHTAAATSSATETSATTAPPTSTVISTVVQTPAQTPTVTRTQSARATPDVPGTDWQGFYDGPRCNSSDDPAVAIGQTPRSRVVICQVGDQTGRWYYKGAASGGTIEVGYPTRSGDTFTAVNGSVTYVLSPDNLEIIDNGQVAGDEPMSWFWTLD